MRHLDDAVTAAGGVALRYGGFYCAANDGWAELVRKRQFPIIGDGGGVFSFVHLDDAAAATVLALERGEPGIYNVVDDEPSPVREWLPVLARMLGARPPRRVPRWLARLLAGEAAVMIGTESCGASNAKAKGELGWTLRATRAGGKASPRCTRNRPHRPPRRSERPHLDQGRGEPGGDTGRASRSCKRRCTGRYTTGSCRPGPVGKPACAGTGRVYAVPDSIRRAARAAGLASRGLADGRGDAPPTGHMRSVWRGDGQSTQGRRSPTTTREENGRRRAPAERKKARGAVFNVPWHSAAARAQRSGLIWPPRRLEAAHV
jgi:hypothetical protein